MPRRALPERSISPHFRCHWHLIQTGVAAKVLDRFAHLSRQAAEVELLSQREKEVVGLMATGAANKEIAVSLSVSESRVKTHVASIFSKLDVTDRTQTVTVAIRQGIVKI